MLRFPLEHTRRALLTQRTEYLYSYVPLISHDVICYHHLMLGGSFRALFVVESPPPPPLLLFKLAPMLGSPAIKLSQLPLPRPFSLVLAAAASARASSSPRRAARVDSSSAVILLQEILVERLRADELTIWTMERAEMER